MQHKEEGERSPRERKQLARVQDATLAGANPAQLGLQRRREQSDQPDHKCRKRDVKGSWPLTFIKWHFNYFVLHEIKDHDFRSLFSDLLTSVSMQEATLSQQ